MIKNSCELVLTSVKHNSADIYKNILHYLVKSTISLEGGNFSLHSYTFLWKKRAKHGITVAYTSEIGGEPIFSPVLFYIEVNPLSSALLSFPKRYFIPE